MILGAHYRLQHVCELGPRTPSTSLFLQRCRLWMKSHIGEEFAFFSFYNWCCGRCFKNAELLFMDCFCFLTTCDFHTFKPCSHILSELHVCVSVVSVASMKQHISTVVTTEEELKVKMGLYCSD